MLSPTDIRRVIVVVLDGLRPDAIDAFDLGHVRRLAQCGASSMRARTVSPSLTWPALTSLLTGVEPRVHGVLSDSIFLPRPRTTLHPLPTLLARSGYPSFAFLGDVPLLYRGVARRIAKGLGFSEAFFTGRTAFDVLCAARSTVATQRDGLLFLHWADADRTGHEHGWMSAQYGDAARRLDATLGCLAEWTHIDTDRNTLLVLVADHGGGGVVKKHHEDDHPLNTTIPLIFAGAAVQQGGLGAPHLTDVPATVAWALGVQVHGSYTGRVLAEAFDPGLETAVA